MADDKSLIEWYEGLPPELDAFTRIPDNLDKTPEDQHNQHQMEIEIRPKDSGESNSEKPEDNEIKRIERQAEYQKAILMKVEKLAVETLDNENSEKSKKEIKLLSDKLLETINYARNRKETGRDNKDDESAD